MPIIEQNTTNQGSDRVALNRSTADAGQGPYPKLAQGVLHNTNDATIDSIDLFLVRNNSPTGVLSITIETNSGGFPSGTVITNGTSNNVNEADVPAGFTYVNFSFATAPTITAGTQYHIVLNTTGTASDVDNIAFGNSGATGNTYANGAPAGKKAGVWEATGEDDFNFKMNGNEIIVVRGIATLLLMGVG